MGQVKNFHIHIEGRVQGVGYRRFAQQKALTFGIKGWVRNRVDGRVEIKATGLEVQMSEFLKELSKGPAFSKVREVKTEVTSETQIEDFEIVQDEELK